MNAITTRYLGPTNTRPGRIVAEGPNGQKVTIEYPHDAHDAGGPQTHSLAVEAFLRKYDRWPQDGWVAGGTRNGYAFVRPDGEFFPRWETRSNVHACGPECISAQARSRTDNA